MHSSDPVFGCEHTSSYSTPAWKVHCSILSLCDVAIILLQAKAKLKLGYGEVGSGGSGGVSLSGPQNSSICNILEDA